MQLFEWCQLGETWCAFFPAVGVSGPGASGHNGSVWQQSYQPEAAAKLAIFRSNNEGTWELPREVLPNEDTLHPIVHIRSRCS